MKFEELLTVLGTNGDTISLEFAERGKSVELTTDCVEILRGIAHYDVIDITPCDFMLNIVIQEPKEAKK